MSQSLGPGHVIIEDAIIDDELGTFRNGFETLAQRFEARSFTDEPILTQPAICR